MTRHLCPQSNLSHRRGRTKMIHPVMSTGRFFLAKVHSAHSIHTEDGALYPFRLMHVRLSDIYHLLNTLLMTVYTASHSCRTMAPPQQIHIRYSPSRAYTARSTYLHLNRSPPLIASASPPYPPSQIPLQCRMTRAFFEYGQISGLPQRRLRPPTRALPARSSRRTLKTLWASACQSSWTASSSLTVVRRSTADYRVVCPPGRHRSLRSGRPRTGSSLYGGRWHSSF